VETIWAPLDSLRQTLGVRSEGIHHVSINVDDVGEALTFYTEVLGFTKREDRPFDFDGAWLDVGDQQVHLIKGQVPPSNGQHYAIRVEDLGKVVEELRGRGVQVTDPMPVVKNLQAFLADPSGNTIELHQVGC
jgi:glyoxylase I family protein